MLTGLSKTDWITLVSIIISFIIVVPLSYYVNDIVYIVWGFFMFGLGMYYVSGFSEDHPRCPKCDQKQKWDGERGEWVCFFCREQA